MVEPQHFEVFMHQHQDMVFGTAVRLLGSASDAEDVSQEVFIRAYDHFDTVRAYEHPAAWLRTVTRRICLNHLERYRSRWRFFSEIEDSNDENPLVIAQEENQIPRADHADRSHLLDQALQRLPDAQRIPLVLFHLEDLSYDEIAQQTGLPLGTVKTNMHRGRQTLARYLQTHRLAGELDFVHG